MLSSPKGCRHWNLFAVCCARTYSFIFGPRTQALSSAPTAAPNERLCSTFDCAHGDGVISTTVFSPTGRRCYVPPIPDTHSQDSRILLYLSSQFYNVTPCAASENACFPSPRACAGHSRCCGCWKSLQACLHHRFCQLCGCFGPWLCASSLTRSAHVAAVSLCLHARVHWTQKETPRHGHGSRGYCCPGKLC